MKAGLKTTLILPEVLMERLKEKAAKTGYTISEMVEDAVRLYLAEKPPVTEPPPLPSWDMGEFLVDITNKESFYEDPEGFEDPEDKE